jgi:hypothetical protein
VCNCDAKTPAWARDEVVIIKKKHLPMTGLTYGPITEDWQTMKFSVGPLKCSGSLQFTGKKTIMKPFYIRMSQGFQIDLALSSIFDVILVVKIPKVSKHPKIEFDFFLSNFSKFFQQKLFF